MLLVIGAPRGVAVQPEAGGVARLAHAAQDLRRRRRHDGQQEERRDAGGQVIKAAHTQFKTCNREFYGYDFLWVRNEQLGAR
ncbi:MAG: hypothetical protein ACLGHP_11665, partial [Vicinamibacteria bacterium]